jgi:hypothetical protein
MCTERSDDCVATYSFSGSHATPWTKWLCSAICRTQVPVACQCPFRSLRHLDQPLEALYILATLSMLPVMKNIPSGDHARSYISDPVLDLHIVLTRQCSTSSLSSSPRADCNAGFSDGVHSSTLPSSPADASSSPLGHHLTTLTACVCFLSVERYVTVRSSPFASIFQSCTHLRQRTLRFPLAGDRNQATADHYACTAPVRSPWNTVLTRTLPSPPEVARRPFPCGSKCAE